MADREGLQRYHALLKMRELETRGAAHLATKFRLTNQSRFRPDEPEPIARAGQERPKTLGKPLNHRSSR